MDEEHHDKNEQTMNELNLTPNSKLIQTTERRNCVNNLKDKNLDSLPAVGFFHPLLQTNGLLLYRMDVNIQFRWK